MAVGGGCVAALAMYLYIPTFLEQRLLRSLALSMGFVGFEGEVRCATTGRFDLANAAFGDPRRPTIYIDSARFDYSLNALRHGRVNGATISGMTIFLELKDGKWQLRGLKPPAAAKPATEKTASTAKKPPGPWFDNLRLSGAKLSLEADGKTFTIPFEFFLFPGREGSQLYYIFADVAPRDQLLTISGQFNPFTKDCDLKLDTKDFDLGKLDDAAKAFLSPLLSLSGKLTLNTSVAFANGKLAMADVKGKLGDYKLGFGKSVARDLLSGPTLFDCRYNHRDGKGSCHISGSRLGGVLNSAVEDFVAHWDNGQVSGQLQLSLENKPLAEESLTLEAANPAKVSFKARQGANGFSGDISAVQTGGGALSGDGWEAGATGFDFRAGDASFAGGRLLLPFTANAKGVTAAWNKTAGYSGDAVLSGEFAADSQKATFSATLASDGAKLTLKHDKLSVDERATSLKAELDCNFPLTSPRAAKGSAKFTATLIDQQARVANFSIISTAATFTADAAFDLMAERSLLSSFTFAVDKSALKSPNWTGHGDKLKVNGSLSMDAAGQLEGDVEYAAAFSGLKLAMTGETDVASIACGGSVQAVRRPGERLKLRGNTRLDVGQISSALFSLDSVAISLPWAFNLGEGQHNGSFKLNGIKARGVELGSLVGKLTQSGDLVEFDLRDNLLYPDLELSLRGRSDLFKGHPSAFLSFKKTDPASAWDLGMLAPALDGWTLSGGLAAVFNYDAGRSPAVSATVSTRRASVRNAARNAVVDGLNVSIEIPDLIKPSTPPEQTIMADRVAFGRVNATNLFLAFQIESTSSFFLERCNFDWCGGNVYARAGRYKTHPGAQDEFELALNCSALRLADVINQFWDWRASGSGVLSGRIPLTYKNGEFSFNDGYLHSTPGESGILSVPAATGLATALPEGSDANIQMQITEEALKKFIYDWARVKIDTKDGLLDVELKLYGKPADPLPFVPDGQGFAKTSDIHSKTVFQGIGLDINVTPFKFNELLRYKTGSRNLLPRLFNLTGDQK